MLKQRFITGLILFSILAWGILTLPTEFIAYLLGFFIAVGAWEWSRLMLIENFILRLAYVLFILFLLAVGWWSIYNFDSIFFAMLTLAIMWWLAALVIIKMYPNKTALYSHKWVKFLIGAVLLVPTWTSLVAIHGSTTHGPHYVVYLILLTSIADTGAYFGGKRWGKTKLAPQLSPGKTREGAASALMSTLLFSAIFAMFFASDGDLTASNYVEITKFVMLSVVVAAFSIVGDLMESLFKRLVNLKDSGTILPGHGGILDRIDSMTAAAPCFVFGLWLVMDFELVSPG